MSTSSVVHAEISNKAGQFHDRDLYITVLNLDGKALAHGQKEELIGKGLIDAKDPDGKLFVKERIELARATLFLAELQVHESSH